MRKVVWTQTALRHLVSIYEYISKDSPRYAARLIDRILSRSEQIVSFPESGAVVPEFRDDRVRQMVEKPYRIIYLIGDDRIDILAVVHGAREVAADS